MKSKITRTYQLIKDDIINTPLERNENLNKHFKFDLLLKREDLQKTGSFKYRGAASKIFQLVKIGYTDEKIVLASTGNHAAAVIEAFGKFGYKPIIFVPKTITKAKKENISGEYIKVIEFGDNCAESEMQAAKFAAENNIPLIHPYNDIDIIAGQGTLGLEIIEQMYELEYVFVPIGGGGLISGIASYIKDIKFINS